MAVTSWPETGFAACTDPRLIASKANMSEKTPNEVMRGRLHYIGEQGYYASRGRHILVSYDKGLTWVLLASVPVGSAMRLKAASRLTTRLFRAEVHHIVPLNDDVVVFAFGYIWVFDRRLSSWSENPKPIQGARPLAVCNSDGILYYGEYRPNEARDPIDILGSTDKGRSWRVVHQCDGIRHIHGVFHDPFTQSIWFTTGDEDHECGIWSTQDNFKNVNRVLGGSQQFRAVDLIFTESHVYFGTDTPLEQNYIYRVTRDGATVERLSPIPSSVFYGARVGRRVFFGSVCEPSAVNETYTAVILGSDESGTTWREVIRLGKDPWPMKLFQYGQFRFPRGENQSRYLWFAPLALMYDQVLCRVLVEG